MGLVSVELFDRSIEVYILSRESFVVWGVYDGFELQRQENGSDGHVRGVSLTWSQPISAPILLENLSLNINYLSISRAKSCQDCCHKPVVSKMGSTQIFKREWKRPIDG